MLPQQINSSFITYQEIYSFMYNYNSYFCWREPEHNLSNNSGQKISQISEPNKQSLKSNQELSVEQAEPKNETLMRKKHLRNAAKEGESAKKNGESNLVNQFFSLFDSRERSSKVVLKVILMLDKPQLARQKIATIFYHVIRLINIKRGRKYVNRFFLKKIFTASAISQFIPELETKMQKVEEVNLSQICKVIRKCWSYFIKNVCACAVLTSKRISAISKQEHLRKRRIIHGSINTIGYK